MKRGPPLPVQYMVFGKWTLRINSGRAAARISAAGLPAMVRR